MYVTDTNGRLSIAAHSDDEQARMAIQHNAQRFRSIFDSVDESIALLKPNGDLIEVNVTAAK